MSTDFAKDLRGHECHLQGKIDLRIHLLSSHIIISGFSEAVIQMFATIKVRVLFRPHNMLRRQLVRVKDPTPTLHTSNVVYSIPCKTCSSVYIGQTGRLLKTRVDEHKTAVKYARTEESVVAEHVWVHNHQVDFQSVSILARESNLHRRLALESWFIPIQYDQP